jgi:nitrilase
MRVAAVQLAPAFLDRSGTIGIVVESLRRAAADGASLVAFPETFVPGYPVWTELTHASYFDHPAQKAAFAQYLDAAVDLARGDLQPVVDASAELDVFTYLGVLERSESRGSAYCSLVAIDPVDGIVSVHRKLKPTFGERLVWADGDGAGLVVHDHRGVRVSGLNCWENWMPLARTAKYAQGAEVHVATWPGSPGTSHDVSRFIAREGRMFVVSSGAILRAEHLPEAFPLRDEMIEADDLYCDGGAIIVGPDGTVIAEATPNEECILLADLDLESLRRERHNFDPTGHYSRPDVFGLHVDRRRRSTLHVTDS